MLYLCTYIGDFLVVSLVLFGWVVLSCFGLVSVGVCDRLVSLVLFVGLVVLLYRDWGSVVVGMDR